MPELPEIEAVRRRTQRAVAGRRIREVATSPDPIVYAGITPARFARAVRGRRIEAVRRRGKHLWFELDRRPWPAFHFGMTGWFHLYRDTGERPRFWKAELLLEGGLRLTMTDTRRFGRIRLQDDPEREPPIADLGFDPLLEMPSAAELQDALARRGAPIKAVLLDQGLFAGVGNWLADEVLYQAGLDPHRRARDLTGDEVRRLRSRLLAIIARAVSVGADSDRFPRSWIFHHRWGRNAEARTARGERIVHHTVGGRTTAWVPARQR